MQNTIYDVITQQNLDHYFSFKHIPGCGKQLRPMNYVKNNDSFDDAAITIRSMIYERMSFLLSNKTNTYAQHILLSGGLDSCITLHCLRDCFKGRIISHTLNFTGTWQGKNTDLEYARKLSTRYKTEHHEHIVTSGEMLSDMTDILSLLKTPFSGVMSPYFASKMLIPNTDVFTGDLSDELFGSYKGPREASLFTDISREDLLHWRSHLNGWMVFSKEEKEKLYSERFKSEVDLNSSLNLLKRWMPDTDDKVNAMLGLDWVSTAPDQVFYSPQNLMTQNDLSPFMCPNLIDYVTALPGEFKVYNGDVKFILKKAFEDRIPSFVIEREKEGFVQPSNYWMKHCWEKEVRDTLSKPCYLFNPEYVNDLVLDYYAGNDSLQYKVWNLFCFMIWETKIA